MLIDEFAQDFLERFDLLCLERSKNLTLVFFGQDNIYLNRYTKQPSQVFVLWGIAGPYRLCSEPDALAFWPLTNLGHCESVH